MVHYIRNVYGLPLIKRYINVTCIKQIKKGYIKGDKIKYISPKFFFTHEFQKSHEIELKQIKYNVADLFTKVLLSSTFKKFTYDIGMRL